MVGLLLLLLSWSLQTTMRSAVSKSLHFWGWKTLMMWMPAANIVKVCAFLKWKHIWSNPETVRIHYLAFCRFMLITWLTVMWLNGVKLSAAVWAQTSLKALVRLDSQSTDQCCRLEDTSPLWMRSVCRSGRMADWSVQEQDIVLSEHFTNHLWAVYSGLIMFRSMSCITVNISNKSLLITLPKICLSYLEFGSCF